MSYECDECGTDVPNERKKVARFFANLCVTCASNMDSTLETGLTIVPSHKGSFTAVRGLKNVYEVTCSPKNYDHDFAGSLS